jgi:hypothetical protein
MIAELAELLENFPGPANQTRCFMHVINLVVKSIIRQFDLPTSKGDRNVNEATKELLLLAGDIDFKEEAMAGIDEEDGVDGDNTEGWIDERETMTEEELDELEESVGSSDSSARNAEQLSRRVGGKLLCEFDLW